jgi:hypothetical protein
MADLSAALREQGCDVGASIAAWRDTPQGRLDWQIAVRDDGCLLAGGALADPHRLGPHAAPDAFDAAVGRALAGVDAARAVPRRRGAAGPAWR